MGILYDIFNRNKKRCERCGCIMEPDSEFDMCEVCLDELSENNLGDPEVDDW
jgi:RNA polymerase subunit RPABC4/transcription elongation factor Spt4